MYYINFSHNINIYILLQSTKKKIKEYWCLRTHDVLTVKHYINVII